MLMGRKPQDTESKWNRKKKRIMIYVAVGLGITILVVGLILALVLESHHQQVTDINLDLPTSPFAKKHGFKVSNN